MKLKVEAKINDRIIHGSVVESFVIALAGCFLGERRLGNIGAVRLINPDGGLIKEFSPIENFSVEYSETQKQYMISFSIEDRSSDAYTVGKIVVFAKFYEEMWRISEFEGLNVSKASDQYLKFEYALIIEHDDMNKKQAEKIVDALVGNISPSQFPFTSVELYDASDTLIKEVTNKTVAQYQDGYENEKYYVEAYLEFQDTSENEYTVAKAKYKINTGEVMIEHSGLNVYKPVDKPLIIKLHDRFEMM